MRPGSSGQVIPGYEARLLDDDNRPVSAGEIGNLLVKGDSTAQATGTCTSEPERCLMVFGSGRATSTGSDEDGFFWHAGRSDDMLKVGGIWVSPVEVENALLEHADVLECAVIGRLDHDGLTKPAAYIVLAPGVTASPERAHEMVQFVCSRLPSTSVRGG